jgi:D-tyrosyl-tRNA(Tyr) deacylase
MRALIQRVTGASVMVDGSVYASIGTGLLIFLGITHGDSTGDVEYLARRCCDLRIFEDGNGKMNRSVRDVEGAVLVVSQFTLYGDTRKGNRPSFVDAAPPEISEPLYNSFVEEMLSLLGQEKVKTGQFRAMMSVQLVNDGPVTVTVESKRV